MYFYYHRVIPVVKYSYGVVLGWYDVCFVWNETKSVVFRVLARKFLKVRKKKNKNKKNAKPKTAASYQPRTDFHSHHSY